MKISIIGRNWGADNIVNKCKCGSRTAKQKTENLFQSGHQLYKQNLLGAIK